MVAQTRNNLQNPRKIIDRSGIRKTLGREVHGHMACIGGSVFAWLRGYEKALRQIGTAFAHYR